MKYIIPCLTLLTLGQLSIATPAIARVETARLVDCQIRHSSRGMVYVGIYETYHGYVTQFFKRYCPPIIRVDVIDTW